jgi:type III pantothenate kinase
MLCIDFGNSRKKAALVTETGVQQVFYFNEDQNLTDKLQEILKQTGETHCILSSVVNYTAEVDNFLQKNTHYHKLSHLSKLNFTTPVGAPSSIGADRLALACGAVHFYPKQNNLVISLGTCITYNFINQNHSFLGGSISPGLQLRFKSMNDYTALLPLITELPWPKIKSHEPSINGKTNQLPLIPLMGYDTKTNMLSGVVYGMAAEIDGIINSYKAKFDNFNPILTGGNTLNFAPLLQNKIFADPEFLFKGLYAIGTQNFNT